MPVGIARICNDATRAKTRFYVAMRVRYHTSYESRTCSARLHCVVTSSRLENLHWAVLEEIAGRDRVTAAQLIEKPYDEFVADRCAVGNSSSFLRVCALRYENLTEQGLIPRDASVPIRSLDADRVLGGLDAAPRRVAPVVRVEFSTRALN